MNIKRMLHPTDFTDGSALSAEWALDLASKYSARLTLVHVVIDLESLTGWYVPSSETEGLFRDMLKRAEGEMDTLLTRLRAISPVEIEGSILRGVPEREIVSYANANAVDLIVMGTHGRAGIESLIFGSTASRVVKTSRCPVLTVRSQ